MPALFALIQHSALLHNATLREGEMLFANLDDIHVLCDPDRVAEIFLQVRHALHHAEEIQIDLGKTKFWNGAAIKQDLDLKSRSGLADKEGSLCNCWPCQCVASLHAPHAREHCLQDCAVWIEVGEGLCGMCDTLCSRTSGQSVLEWSGGPLH